jgi:hypothetical protein
MNKLTVVFADDCLRRETQYLFNGWRREGDSAISIEQR